MYLSNRLAGWGERLNQIEQEKAMLKEENKKLKTKLLTSSNMNSLERMAEEKGFIENPEVLNLTPKVPVALNP
jgi:predicted nuclease with TOPRIM domain